METKIWQFDSETIHGASSIKEAAAFLRDGKLVAFPTETVYGLGADARSDAAVKAIFEAKGRPSDNPLIVHIADRSQLGDLVLELDAVAQTLCERFWPGPLTIVLPVRPGAVSGLVTAGLSTVAVRMPSHPIALALLRAADCPVAAPSANLSGRPSPTRAEHVLEDLNGKIAGIIDGGPCGVGLESTVVQWKDDVLHILRPGGITPEQLKEIAPIVDMSGAAEGQAAIAPRSPGMKYTHYAPRGELVIVKAKSVNDAARFIQRQVDEARAQGESTGVLTFQPGQDAYRADTVLACGNPFDLSEAARQLYDCLRRFDEAGTARIWAEACEEQGIGFALMNRLRKAAGNRIVEI